MANRQIFRLCGTLYKWFSYPIVPMECKQVHDTIKRTGTQTITARLEYSTHYIYVTLHLLETMQLSDILSSCVRFSGYFLTSEIDRI